jgi:hypothetical protein
MFEEHGAFYAHFEDGAFYAVFLCAEGVVVGFDFCQAPFELDTLSVVGCFDRWWERGVGGDAVHDSVCGRK